MIAVWSYIIYELYDAYINLFYLFMSITLYQYWNCTCRNKEIIRTEMTAIATLFRAQTWLLRPWFKVTGPWTENIRSSKSIPDKSISLSESIHFQSGPFSLVKRFSAQDRIFSHMNHIIWCYFVRRWTLVKNQIHHSVPVGFLSE